MKLGNDVEMVLGTVLDDNDPKKLGRVKVGAPGWFDRVTMSIDAIPWAYPLTMGHMQSYTHMSTGSKVWLIINKVNQEELYWIPFHELNEDTKEAISDDVETDVLFSRNTQGKKVQIYNNKTEGLIIRNGSSVIKLSNDGKILVEQEDSKGYVKIEGGQVFCGKDGGTMYKMVKGEKLQDLINNLAGNFEKLYEAAQANPYTGSLAAPFQKTSKDLTNDVKDILAEKVFVTE